MAPIQLITSVLSDHDMSQYPARLQENMVVIPNPVAMTAEFQADVTGSHHSRKVLLSVGRLTEQKDHATLISAFSAIADSVPDWDLRIIGDGELRAALEAQIAALGLEARIFLPGATNDVQREYRNAQLFVLPSRYESLGLVLIEALNHGLPAVGYADCTGVNRIIRSGTNGLLVSGADRVEALAQGLRELMTNTGLRKGLVQPITGIPQEFRLDGVLDRWEDVLRRCHSGGRGRHANPLPGGDSCIRS